MNPTLATQFSPEIDRILDTGTGAPAHAVPQALADRFQSMMQQGASPTPLDSLVGQSGHGSIVTKAVEEQAEYYRQVPNDVLYMSQHLSALSMERLAAADMTIQLEIASMNADLQVKMAAVQSSKDAMQTLMKNQ